MTSIHGNPQPMSTGEALFQELLWVHGMLRRDLEVVQQLAEQVRSGATPEHVQNEVASLQSNSALWKFRANCLYYCRFVHAHHTHEDRLLFPALRSSNPALNPVVDKLEADHRKVAEYIHEVESAARSLAKSDTDTNRTEVFDALQGLADHLLEHLAYEEESIAPTMRKWDEWPSY